MALCPPTQGPLGTATPKETSWLYDPWLVQYCIHLHKAENTGLLPQPTQFPPPRTPSPPSQLPIPIPLPTHITRLSLLNHSDSAFGIDLFYCTGARLAHSWHPAVQSRQAPLWHSGWQRTHASQGPSDLAAAGWVCPWLWAPAGCYCSRGPGSGDGSGFLRRNFWLAERLRAGSVGQRWLGDWTSKRDAVVCAVTLTAGSERKDVNVSKVSFPGDLTIRTTCGSAARAGNWTGSSWPPALHQLRACFPFMEMLRNLEQLWWLTKVLPPSTWLHLTFAMCLSQSSIHAMQPASWILTSTQACVNTYLPE